MSKQHPERRLELSPAQVAGSALAAMSGAAIISWAGTAGTLIGAAAGSVIATVGAATYTWSLQRTRDAVKRTAAQVRQTALVSSGPTRTMAGGSLREDETAPGDAEDETPERSGRLDLPWAKVALASLAVMVLGLAGVTVVETVTGKPLASLLGRDTGTGTTVGRVVASDKSSSQEETTSTNNTPATPETTPSEEPSEEPEQAAPSTTPEPTPTPSTTPDTPEQTEGSGAPAPDNTQP
jgi:hypothetical protein